jgi:hypothetical protein
MGYLIFCAGVLVGMGICGLFRHSDRDDCCSEYRSIDIGESFENLRKGCPSTHDEENFRDAAEFERMRKAKNKENK